ncbi:sigma-54 dependent transcriptional regulator [Magnetospira sp. QH-2]|uniref:nitrogen assimilation response regulator NtrX n=1 Tax=Magnetospira sp. (strain QH-2) TaxID=1288970 RepID=UPI0003E81472|nr:sigma-54 dependent transcriptional regulator [Magnetospira sp. QH-2]CCQ73801.1 Nitrogen assimilation regulatory protein [Magnetospira sp. QH-2]
MALDILIVDDEADIRMLTAGVLEDEGFQTREAADSTSALEEVQSRCPGLVLLDIWLQGSILDGLGILKEIKARNPDLPVVMMSGHGTIETAVAAIREGAYDFVEKPFQADRMLLVVQRAMEAARLREENAELRLRAGPETDLIGKSPALAQVRQSIEKVAPTNSRVLITGPAGSGKEVAARLLHTKSRRAEGPFVVVNCATMEPDRVEAVLFGTEDGESIQTGTFERADSGTLLLDEVADMPLETQGKIVRILQEQKFQRVGGGSRIEVDVRVVASSTRDLNEEIAAGHFREDLFYRLSVVPIDMPPLNKRREDIPVLARQFMKRAAEGTGQPTRSFGDDSLAALQAYDWPGNVRELRNIVERLLIMAPGGAGEPIRADALPAEIGSSANAALGWDKSGEIMALPLREARELFERQYLTIQVDRFGGNISRTASFVGMERSALHRKLKTLGIQGEDKARKAESK